MSFTTSISEVTEGAVNLRGYSLGDVMRHTTYTDGAFLTIVGRLPSREERRLLDVMMNSLLDHGWVASTITAARYVASGNPQFIPAVAGGLLACGSNTVSPQHSFELLARAAALREEQGMGFVEAAAAIVEEYQSQKRRIPGLGHPTHKSNDFRAEVLFEIADEVGLAGTGCRQYRAVHKRFVEVTGKTNLPVNIDGALAVVGYDLGWSAQQTVAFAVLSVLPGVMAHVIEELEGGKPLRYVSDGTYSVPPLRPVPPTQNGASE